MGISANIKGVIDHTKTSQYLLVQYVDRTMKCRKQLGASGWEGQVLKPRCQLCNILRHRGELWGVYMQLRTSYACQKVYPGIV